MEIKIMLKMSMREWIAFKAGELAAEYDQMVNDAVIELSLKHNISVDMARVFLVEAIAIHSTEPHGQMATF